MGGASSGSMGLWCMTPQPGWQVEEHTLGEWEEQVTHRPISCDVSGT